ncbi:MULTISPECIES: AtpZ/AtpI family protein [Halocynthiibacter]|uniref:ATP synthase protein I n=1 Tax=Halocynthiibacter halioticoli TaxID=2986804 RepID=A0AAE3J2E6_9RHOB|nr:MULTISPECIES: AtpZ/AtpI family protein [Halocynthiibacter]MCV6825443.1 AtpZ/AtpI family protein [Halocynthiibacter halioticoli]MCW4058444.1 AtpZ/AtpI family protein [Halocynthiibacter sp. SDUM655004]MDE0588538.1 AtpZ/AtpI family protein [Halocynthiibacter sp. C4]
MAKEHNHDQLKRLEDKIDKLKKSHEPAPPKDEHYSLANQAWRMVIELVVGLGIGFGIGYGLDVLFGTLPIFMVLFTLLGFAAGVKTMIRTASELQSEKEKADADSTETTAAHAAENSKD